MKLSIAIITSLALISSTVTALALPNEQDLVTRRKKCAWLQEVLLSESCLIDMYSKF